MELNERKKIILRAIIEDYIESAEPVGSRTISSNTSLGLSSATIRNEMSDLEEMGYLISPHTSAGRIPTDAGYRFYVNELMVRKTVSEEDISRLKKYFAAGIIQLDRLIQRAGSVISYLTDYTTITVTPEIRRSTLKRFDIMVIDKYSVLLILVTSEGVVKNKMINACMTESFARDVSELLNKLFSGKSLDSIGEKEAEELLKKIPSKSLLAEILSFIKTSAIELNGSEIFVENPQNMLNHPEYHEVGRARGLLEFMGDKKSVKSALDSPDEAGISARIGSENTLEQIKDTSIVTASYKLDGKDIGKIGIVGPTRMDYSKVFGSLETIKRSIDDIVVEIYKSESEESGREK